MACLRHDEGSFGGCRQCHCHIHLLQLLLQGSEVEQQHVFRLHPAVERGGHLQEKDSQKER